MGILKPLEVLFIIRDGFKYAGLFFIFPYETEHYPFNVCEELGRNFNVNVLNL